MKIILKIVLYAAMIILLSVSLGEIADSHVEPAKPNASPEDRRTKVEAMPYGASRGIRVNNPIYTETVTFNLELTH